MQSKFDRKFHENGQFKKGIIFTHTQNLFEVSLVEKALCMKF